MKNFQRKLEPVYIAGIVIGAPAMPEWMIAASALLLVGVSAWMFLADRGATRGKP